MFVKIIRCDFVRYIFWENQSCLQNNRLQFLVHCSQLRQRENWKRNHKKFILFSNQLGCHLSGILSLTSITTIKSHGPLSFDRICHIFALIVWAKMIQFWGFDAVERMKRQKRNYRSVFACDVKMPMIRILKEVVVCHIVKRTKQWDLINSQNIVKMLSSNSGKHSLSYFLYIATCMQAMINHELRKLLIILCIFMISFILYFL